MYSIYVVLGIKPRASAGWTDTLQLNHITRPKIITIIVIAVVILVVTIVIIGNQCGQPDVWSAGTKAPPISILPVLGLLVYAIVPTFCVGAGDLNSRPYAYMTSTHYLSHLPRPYIAFDFSTTMSPFCCSLCWLGFLLLLFCFGLLSI